MLELKYSRQAKTFLRNYDAKERILKRIEELQKKPVDHNTKRVIGVKEKIYRARVGKYRILYEIDHKKNTLGIIKIDNRARAYK